MRSKHKEIAATVTQKNFRISHGRRLGHNEIQQLGKEGVKADRIERKNYSSARQGPNNTISNLTAPSLEVPRKVSRASTLTRETAVPIAQRGIQTKQIISKSYNTYRNSTTGTNEGSHQKPREEPNISGKSLREIRT